MQAGFEDVCATGNRVWSGSYRNRRLVSTEVHQDRVEAAVKCVLEGPLEEVSACPTLHCLTRLGPVTRGPVSACVPVCLSARLSRMHWHCQAGFEGV